MAVQVACSRTYLIAGRRFADEEAGSNSYRKELEPWNLINLQNDTGPCAVSSASKIIIFYCQY